MMHPPYLHFRICSDFIKSDVQILLAQIYFWGQDSKKMTHCQRYKWHLVFWTQQAQICDCQGKNVCINRLKCLQSAHQMIGIDLWECVDFLYLLHLLNPNNLLSLIQPLQPQSRFCSVCCFRSGFENPLFNCLMPSASWVCGGSFGKKSKVPSHVPADLLRKFKMLPCLLLWWKIGRWKHPGKDEAVIKNCWCWRQ